MRTRTGTNTHCVNKDRTYENQRGRLEYRDINETLNRMHDDKNRFYEHIASIKTEHLKPGEEYDSNTEM